MAYSTTYPPMLVYGSISGVGPNIWSLYGTDASATVRVSGYITNGGDLGMKANDLVIYTDTNLQITSTLNVATVSSTAPGAVDLQDATVIGSTTNTD